MAGKSRSRPTAQSLLQKEGNMIIPNVEARMANKKAPKPEASMVTRDAEGFLCLEGTYLWKWRALSAEHGIAVAELETAVQQIQAEVAKNTVLSNLYQKKAGLLGQISVAKAEILAMQGEIEKAIGIPLRECSFEDRTGRFHHLAADNALGPPIAAKKSSSRKPTK